MVLLLLQSPHEAFRALHETECLISQKILALDLINKEG